MCLIGQRFAFNSIESLVGHWIVQTAQPGVRCADLEIVNKRHQMSECFKLTVATVQTGALSMIADDAQRLL